ncbi:hypothetical protein U9M48_017452 [Paspalum notatum var. saurae]|uniref:Uncharacterized protein n=1 Tax=Paspalum notatum var. saurae TaxID=547442 RepID=A0AAQ3T8J7_PASNO
MDGSGARLVHGWAYDQQFAGPSGSGSAAAVAGQACGGSGAARHHAIPRATGACRCPPRWGRACTICRSRASASKNKKGPAAGGGWGSLRLRLRLRLRLGGCPTAPRSKQHARGAGRPVDADISGGAHPRRGACFSPHADPDVRAAAGAGPSVHAPRV